MPSPKPARRSSAPPAPATPAPRLDTGDLSNHARQRMRERKVTMADLERALAADPRKLNSALVLSRMTRQHIEVALGDLVLLISNDQPPPLDATIITLWWRNTPRPADAA